MIGVKVNIAGAQRKLNAVRNRLSIEKMLFSIGNAHLFWIGKNFESEGMLGGARWKALSARTLAARRKNGRGAKILRDRGWLAQSFVAGELNNVFRRKRLSVTVGTQTQYAEQHEKGLNGMPRRAMLPSRLRAKIIAKKEVAAVAAYATRGAHK
jgi:phage gpG-like protein